SVVQTRTLDGTPAARRYHGIGSTGEIVPAMVKADGEIPGTRGLGFLVGDRGVAGHGPPLATGQRWRVYRGARLRAAAIGVYSDGWIGRLSNVTVYSGPVSAVAIRLLRPCSTGSAGARFSIRGAVSKRAVMPECKSVLAAVPAPAPPFRLRIT